ncbi:hypothetical protein ACFFX0_26210 [Citricoccus parietis]|uniref:Uncharacterized protein n=1 Tax=Citricoccus parietis TaxID=592307 RepID=A0ABV5G6H0_9MICC
MSANTAARETICHTRPCSPERIAGISDRTRPMASSPATVTCRMTRMPPSSAGMRVSSEGPGRGRTSLLAGGVMRSEPMGAG